MKEQYQDAFEEWLHAAALNDEGGQSCDDMELVKSQRRIIIDIGKQLGRKLLAGNLNLINITLPVVMFEPRSYLQKLADPWVHPVHLESAAAAASPLERLKLSVTWFIAGLQHVFSSWRKPFNPVLGETWQACLPSGSSICCEQVSHHPPVTAFHLEGPYGLFSFDGLSQPEVSFSGGGLKTSARGYRRITFASDGAVVEIAYPYYRIGGLLSGVPHGLIKGTATLTDTTHGLTASIVFGPVPGATSRLLCRADSFEVRIMGPAAAAAAVINVPEWVRQAAADGAARRRAAAAAAGEGASAAVVAAATSPQPPPPAAAAAAAAGGSGPQPSQLAPAGCCHSHACAAATAAVAAAADAGAVTAEVSLSAIGHPSISAGKPGKQRHRLSFGQCKSKTGEESCVMKAGHAQEEHFSNSRQVRGSSGGCSSSKGTSRLASMIRVSGLPLQKIFSSGKSSSSLSGRQGAAGISSSSNSSRSRALASSGSSRSLKGRSQSSSSSKSLSGSAGGGGCSKRQHFSFPGPVACFGAATMRGVDSWDGKKDSGTGSSSAASSRSSSGWPGNSGSCNPVILEAEAEAPAAVTPTRPGGVGSSSSCCLAQDGAAAAAGMQEAQLAAAGDTACCAASPMTTPQLLSSPSSAMVMQQRQQQQQQRVAVQQLSVSCNRQQQQQQQHQEGAGVQLLALGTGCWLSHLDFDGQRYWALAEDTPEAWRPLQQQQQQQHAPPSDVSESWQQQKPLQQPCILPSDCQNRLDLVALRGGDVKLAQQLKEQMEHQQRRDAKLRPSFAHVDCAKPK